MNHQLHVTSDGHMPAKANKKPLQSSKLCWSVNTECLFKIFRHQISLNFHAYPCSKIFSATIYVPFGSRAAHYNVFSGTSSFNNAWPFIHSPRCNSWKFIVVDFFFFHRRANHDTVYLLCDLVPFPKTCQKLIRHETTVNTLKWGRMFGNPKAKTSRPIDLHCKETRFERKHCWDQ